MAIAACGGASPRRSGSMAPGAVAVSTAGATTVAANQIPEQLVIEGSLTVEVEEITDVVPALRASVEQMGGRVINESVTGAEREWSAQVKLRLPPGKVEEVVAFLAKRGDITQKHITATDVSKQLFDQELALKNLHTTLDRLTQLMAQGGLKVTEILEIEKEMTRLRGQIETIEGEQRFLKDRVSLATLDISMTRRAGAVTVARAKAYPGGRAAMLVLYDPGTRKRVRAGGGFVLHTLFRSMSLEVDIFEKAANTDGSSTSAAVMATAGGAAYSDFLGSGRRKTLNPYLGFRLGYGYLDDHRFVVQGEAGVELFKARNVIIDANLRATGLIGSDTDLALIAGAGATFAF
jgi:hypothetical protein